MEYNPEKGWEYELHPKYVTVKEKCDEIIRSMCADETRQDCFLVDTRHTHKTMFIEVTPDGRAYFAGNYRGANYPYLCNYPVQIGDYAGEPPASVEAAMSAFSIEIASIISEFQQKIKSITSTAPQKLVVFCHLLAHLFVKFLAIHPYANGNGHMARLLVWVLLKKEGLTQDFWSVADRPGQPKGFPLDNCIEFFRKGNYEPLIRYFLLGIQTAQPVTVERLLHGV